MFKKIGVEKGWVEMSTRLLTLVRDEEGQGREGMGEREREKISRVSMI